MLKIRRDKFKGKEIIQATLVRAKISLQIGRKTDKKNLNIGKRIKAKKKF